MKQYHEMAQHVLTHGNFRGDRTGTGTQSVFGYQTRFNLKDGFPMLTTKRLPLKSIVAELLWFIAGNTNNDELVKMGSTIWNEWAPTFDDFNTFVLPHEQAIIAAAEQLDTVKNRIGTIGPMYGYAWRSWQGADGETYDQFMRVINDLVSNPYSRRHIVSAWKVEDLPDEKKPPKQNVLEGRMALAPCHHFFQLYVKDMTDSERIAWARDNDCLEITKISGRDGVDEEYNYDDNVVPKRKLSLRVDIRSNDLFLGAPFNIASYALLTHLIAREVNMDVDELIYQVGDLHIYSNHREQIMLQLTREPKALPKLVLNPIVKSIFDFKVEDISLEGYDPYPVIKGQVSY